MTEESKRANEAEANEGQQDPRSRKGAFLGGGILGLVAAAYILVMVAVPREVEPLPFDGPFTIPLTEQPIQVNLRGGGGRNYLNMSLSIKFDAYDQDYVSARVADPVYQADLKDVLILVGRHKTREELEQHIGIEVFKEEVREEIQPLVFPIHVGNERRFDRPHERSGLAPGRSIQRATMRGGFRAHHIHVDVPGRTISLDEGAPVEFEGHETDLLLESENGQTVFLDVSDLDPDFVGDVNVGTFGRVLAVKFDKLITQ